MPKGRPMDYTKRNVNYGRKFMIGKREVMYRYINKDKKTKTLVDARTKKVIPSFQRRVDQWKRKYMK